VFLCKPCFENRMEDAGMFRSFWPVSRGKCEDCGGLADCADWPSAWLPIPSANFKLRMKLEGA
jgi:hypothetical protein